MPSRPQSLYSGWRRAVALVCAGAVAGSAIVAPAQAQNQLPALGDSVSADFEVGFERKIGDEIMREIRRDPDYIDDPLLFDYMQSIWQPLVTAARKHGEISAESSQRFAWEAFLVRDRSVNAFALPGGFVGIHLGLIAMTSSADELASVLAHELSHVTQRHIARGIVNSKRQSLLSAAAMIVGLLAASRSNRGDAANAVITGGQAASIQGQLNFSRDMEREADRIGFSLLTSAGFSSSGMAAMFEKLDQGSRLNDSGGFPYLRSHPLTTERIGAARARLGTADVAAPVGQLEHVLAQARARVLMDTRVQALQRLQTSDQDAVPLRRNDRQAISDALSAAISSAFASTLLRDWPRADAALAQAARLLRAAGAEQGGRAEANLTMLVAESRLERGDAAAAAAALAALPAAHASRRPVVLLAARIAMLGNAADPALRQQAGRLQTWVADHPQDATAWLVLSQVWSRLDFPLRSMRAEAEGRYAIGDLTGAIDRLRAGQTLARAGGPVDFIDASVIDARLRTIEAERRLEMLEREQQRRGG
ncbi:M48 family metalloprotease [Piscinibacter sakaiensis]|uniref:M48 family metalloprotease n=1 Tax=Piscinibacter sakaiensis TaxID=1547922 RepID=UPI003AAFD8A7